MSFVFASARLLDTANWWSGTCRRSLSAELRMADNLFPDLNWQYYV